MDEFGFERQELAGSLISFEFGAGGRIQQLWVADPILPENEEFQFVLPPINLGEEFSEDYNPGTVLLGARTNESDPWILSRNSFAEPLEELDDPMATAFQYDFSLLPEIKATGRFREIPGHVPQMVWDLRFTNEGTSTLEIGELGFPMALNNLYEGFARTDRGLESLYRDRVYIHQHIGGAASYLFAQRLTGEAPGLVVIPGDGTSWEFTTHVPSSLVTPYRWEGIPVVYAHSKATMEREEWPNWFNGHTSRMLEPGDEISAQLCFLSASRDRIDGLHASLATVRHPSMRLSPGGVAPVSVGIEIDLAGATPTQFFASTEAELETDSDEEGGFCRVTPERAGPLKLSFVDTQGRESHAHLMFIEDIDFLMEQRAKWIVERQIENSPGSNLDCAILPTNINGGDRSERVELFLSPLGIESSLSDALFLAEKNTVVPVKEQIAVLERYVDNFFRKWVQNPANGAIGCVFVDGNSSAVHSGRAKLYPMVAALYSTLARIADDGASVLHDRGFYLCQAAMTIKAMREQVDPSAWRSSGVPLMSMLPEWEDEWKKEDIASPWSAEERARELSRKRYPFAGISAWDTGAFDEVHLAAVRTGNYGLAEGTLNATFAARSTAPSWWWHGSEKRFYDDADGPTPSYSDKGELCHGPNGVANAAVFLRSLRRDVDLYPDAILRMAFSSLTAVWAMVREDGAATNSFCPDPASQHAGIHPLTGTMGLGLYHYLRLAGSYVLPSRAAGVFTYGCKFEAVDMENGVELLIRPWDGVGRRIIVRHLGVEAELTGAQIVEARIHSAKRAASFMVANTSTMPRKAKLTIQGLWGNSFEVNGKREHTATGTLVVEHALKAKASHRFEVKVLG